MAKASWTKVQTGIEQTLKGYLDRSKLVAGYLDRVVYKTYQNRQNQRWMTQGASELSVWKPLNPFYAERKKTLFAAYDGGGTKMMIATGALRTAVVGPGKGHRKVINGNRIEINWTTPYAVYTEEQRPVNVWDHKQDKQMYDDLAKYLMKGLISSTIGGGR